MTALNHIGLKPCPFCGVAMIEGDDGLPYFYHPADECVLRNRAWYTDSDAGKWNKREQSQ